MRCPPVEDAANPTMASDKTRVAVLFGGRSSEHEVSVVSAASIIRGLDSDRFEAIPVAIERSGRWLDPERSASWLPAEAASKCATSPVEFRHEPGCSSGFDVVFPALHGPFGEDGRVQGLLDMANVPYVGSGVLGSACGMDKDIMKRLFRYRQLPTLPHITVHRGEAAKRSVDIERWIGYPAFVKPANLGSSVGIRKAQNRTELLESIEYAAEFDRKALVERAVDAREFECAVLGNDDPEASLPGEIATSGGFYDYEAKYETNDAELIVPAKIDPDLTKAIRRFAIEAFQAVGCAGLARVDFFVERATGTILVNEVNTMPGFTSISLFPRMWAASGLAYADLIERLIDLAFERHSQQQALRYDMR